MNPTARLLLAATLFGVLPAAPSFARPEYAARENAACNHCHVVPGGPRNFRGLFYAANNHSLAAFDNQYEAKLAGVDPAAVGGDAVTKTPNYPRRTVPAGLNYIYPDIEGNRVNLARYAGSVVMIVNVASQCGNTPQYAALQKLYEKHKERGLVVLGFPCNDFGAQEPGTEKEIQAFCTEKYKVTFPMFAKVAVKGQKQAPLYRRLTDKAANPKFGGEIEWNFAKFLLNRKGEVIGRFAARTSPDDPELVMAIEAALKEK
jgi:glutathione peroxidase